MKSEIVLLKIINICGGRAYKKDIERAYKHELNKHCNKTSLSAATSRVFKKAKQNNLIAEVPERKIYKDKVIELTSGGLMSLHNQSIDIKKAKTNITKTHNQKAIERQCRLNTISIVFHEIGVASYKSEKPSLYNLWKVLHGQIPEEDEEYKNITSEESKDIINGKGFYYNASEVLNTIEKVKGGIDEYNVTRNGAGFAGIYVNNFRLLVVFDKPENNWIKFHRGVMKNLLDVLNEMFTDVTKIYKNNNDFYAHYAMAYEQTRDYNHLFPSALIITKNANEIASLVMGKINNRIDDSEEDPIITRDEKRSKENLWEKELDKKYYTLLAEKSIHDKYSVFKRQYVVSLSYELDAYNMINYLITHTPDDYVDESSSIAGKSLCSATVIEKRFEYEEGELYIPVIDINQLIEHKMNKEYAMFQNRSFKSRIYVKYPVCLNEIARSIRSDDIEYFAYDYEKKESVNITDKVCIYSECGLPAGRKIFEDYLLTEKQIIYDDAKYKSIPKIFKKNSTEFWNRVYFSFLENRKNANGQTICEVLYEKIFERIEPKTITTKRKRKQKRSRTTINLLAEDKKKIEKLAEQEDVSITKMINKIIQAYVAKEQ